MESDYTNTADMLKQLKITYPDKIPRKPLNECSLAQLQGQQAVIEYIEYSLIAHEARNQGK